MILRAQGYHFRMNSAYGARVHRANERYGAELRETTSDEHHEMRKESGLSGHGELIPANKGGTTFQHLIEKIEV